MAFHKGRLKRKPNLVPSVMVLVNLVLVVSALGYAHVMIVVFGNPFEGEIVELQLPQPIEKLLEGKVNVSIEILDLLAHSLESRDDTNT